MHKSIIKITCSKTIYMTKNYHKQMHFITSEPFPECVFIIKTCEIIRSMHTAYILKISQLYYTSSSI